MKYCFIQDHTQEYPVKRMCQVLGVDESAYYKWRKRLPSTHQLQDSLLAEKIQEAYENNQQVYGSPRLHIERSSRKGGGWDANGLPVSCVSEESA